MTDLSFEQERQLFFSEQTNYSTMLINQRMHQYYCVDTKECIIAYSCEFADNRYMQKATLEIENFKHPGVRYEIKKQLVQHLTEAIDKASAEHRTAPITTVRWQGLVKEMKRVTSENVSRSLSSVMIRDLCALPLTMSEKQTPVDEINWRKEGF